MVDRFAPTPFRVSVVIPVFRDEERVLHLSRTLRTQRLPANVSLEIIVVDDGSGTATVARLREALPADVLLLELGENSGRSCARQAGIDAANGDVILFLDCDCQPEDENYIAAHLASMTANVVASAGPVIGVGGGFWDRYQRKASARRRSMFESGITYSGSTQNLMVTATALRLVGGFDARYRQYGFEDRDLLVRLAALGEIRWSNGATVLHLDELNMVSVAAKMRAAGRETSHVFARQHPIAYKQLGYALIDAREQAWLRLPARIVRHLLRPASKAFDALESRRLLPWPVAFIAARLISAASYLIGTTESSCKR